jgi:hypothetical protein
MKAGYALVYDQPMRSAREKLCFDAATGFQDGLWRGFESTQANMNRIGICLDRHADRLATA